MSDYNNQQYGQQPQPYYQQPPQPYYQQPQPQYYQQPQQPPQPQYVQQQYYQMSPQPQPQPRRRNGIGTVGFVFSLLVWIPFVGVILWFLGLLFSFIGLFKRPKGLAIAGFILTILEGIVAAIVIVIYGAAIYNGYLDDLF